MEKAYSNENIYKFAYLIRDIYLYDMSRNGDLSGELENIKNINLVQCIELDNQNFKISLLLSEGISDIEIEQIEQKLNCIIGSFILKNQDIIRKRLGSELAEEFSKYISMGTYQPYTISLLGRMMIVQL